MLVDFHKGEMDIARLNYDIITLVPKTSDAKKIKKFTAICFLNKSFKIITKVLLDRLSLAGDPIISKLKLLSLRVDTSWRGSSST